MDLELSDKYTSRNKAPSKSKSKTKSTPPKKPLPEATNFKNSPSSYFRSLRDITHKVSKVQINVQKVLQQIARTILFC